MIDLAKLREISKKEPELNRIVMAEPVKMSEKEFLNKFSLLWNLVENKRKAQK